MEEPRTPEAVARTMFHPGDGLGGMDDQMALVLFLVIWLLPLIVSPTRLLVKHWSRDTNLKVPVLVFIPPVLLLVGGFFGFLMQRRTTYSGPASLVFVIHAALPGIASFMATQDVVTGFRTRTYWRVFLGSYNLCNSYVRWADEVAKVAEAKNQIDSVTLFARWHEEVAKVKNVLWGIIAVAFTWESLGLVAAWLGRTLWRPFTVEHDGGFNSWASVGFLLSITGAWGQNMLLDVVRRREVLLKMLGAQKAIHGALKLILRGASTMADFGGVGSFLDSISPSQRTTIAVLVIRQIGLLSGILAPIAWCVVVTLLGNRGPGLVAVVAFAVGVVAGAGVVSAVHSIQLEHSETLSGPYRVVILFPYTTAAAQAALKRAWTMAQTAVVGKTAAVGSGWVAARATSAMLTSVIRRLRRR